MSASVVIGQSNFTDHTVGVTSSTFSDSVLRGLFVDPQGRLIVADRGGNRVLIWNQLPTTNGKAADLVLGQPNFTSSTANNGGRSAQTLSVPGGVYSDGTRLVVTDRANGRVLIWNTFPTTNQQAADVVVGQANMTSATSTCDSSHLNTGGQEGAAWIYNGKLIVSSNAQSRVLIWNSVPTSNGVAADVVLGQSNMTTCSATNPPTQSSLNSPRGLMVDSQGKLFVVDGTNANRVLIWNSIPTSNNVSADVVVGQPNFTSNSTPITAAAFNIPLGVYSNGERLFIADNNNFRVLIYNNIPSTNGANADIVLGQPNFTTATSQYGGISASSMGYVQAVFEYQNKLLIAETAGDRILIFDNIIKTPGFALYDPPEGRDNGIIRLKGKVTVDSLYNVSTVEFAVNGAWTGGAVPTDGSFNSGSEEFYFDFDPRANQSTNAEGYTVQVRSTNTNTDKKDSLFYFWPYTYLYQGQPLQSAILIMTKCQQDE